MSTHESFPINTTLHRVRLQHTEREQDHDEVVTLARFRRTFFDGSELFNVDFYQKGEEKTAYLSWPARIDERRCGQIRRALKPKFKETIGRVRSQIKKETHRYHKQRYQWLGFGSPDLAIRVDLVNKKSPATSEQFDPGMLISFHPGADLSRGLIRFVYESTSQLPPNTDIEQVAGAIEKFTQEQAKKIFGTR